jgi:hypothetical protein
MVIEGPRYHRRPPLGILLPQTIAVGALLRKPQERASRRSRATSRNDPAASATMRKFATTFLEPVASRERPSSLTNTRHQRSSPTLLGRTARVFGGFDRRTGCGRPACLAAGETADGFRGAPMIGRNLGVACSMLRARPPAGRRTRRNFNHRSRPWARRHLSLLIWRDFSMELKIGRNFRKHFGVAASVTGEVRHNV